MAACLSQLADLLQNGVPLLKALDILAEQAAQPELAEVLTEIRDLVAEGTSLDQALARHPRVFGELTVSMVRAGSEGAFLEDALQTHGRFPGTAGGTEMARRRRDGLPGVPGHRRHVHHDWC